MNLNITRASISDAPEILELQKIAYQQEAILYDDWTIPPLTQTLLQIQETFANTIFLKAVSEGRIVGSVRALLDAGTCKIGRLIVHPDFQRMGIGSMLMEEIEAHFPNATRFELFTGTKSVNNIRLYQKLGYAEFHQQDISQNVRIVFMEKMNTRKESEKQALYALLGDLPPRDREISAQVISQTDCETYLLETLVLDLNGIESVPAYFVKPKNCEGQLPCILYNHAHGGVYRLGKDELLIGRDALQSPPYAQTLTENGYAALCIDTWCFGERRGRTESELFKEMLWKGQVLWGMMVYDSLRALDYLDSRSDVDSKRIGTLGLSMGSTMAWWTAALDTRIKVCVDLCCLTDFDALIASQGLDGHGIYYYVPSLLKQFTTAKINALIAPRPHLSLAGNYDPLTPPAGLDRIDHELQQVYKAEKAEGAWQLKRHEIGHFETAKMRLEVLSFLNEWLRHDDESIE